jgi:hypothetical protein
MNSCLWIVTVYFWIVILLLNHPETVQETPKRRNPIRYCYRKLPSSKSDMKLVAWQCCHQFSIEWTVIRQRQMSIRSESHVTSRCLARAKQMVWNAVLLGARRFKQHSKEFEAAVLHISWFGQTAATKEVTRSDKISILSCLKVDVLNRHRQMPVSIDVQIMSTKGCQRSINDLYLFWSLLCACLKNCRILNRSKTFDTS